MIVLILGACLCVIGALAEIDGIRRMHQATETNYRADETFRRAEARFEMARGLLPYAGTIPEYTEDDSDLLVDDEGPES